MKLVLFGATGMVGQGVLREALLTQDVESVLAVVRRPTGQSHPKLKELVHTDFSDFGPVESALTGYDVCIYCVGVSAAGLKEADYRRITHDFTLAAARVLARQNPTMVFLFVSGAGTDSTGKSSAMWARVKGETENALLALPFRAAYVFRPAFIQPVHGERSRTALYRVFYAATSWMYPALRALAAQYVTTTEELSRAMLHVARHGAPKVIIENADLAALEDGARV